jgi:probable phosphoglycerate mutase
MPDVDVALVKALKVEVEVADVVTRTELVVGGRNRAEYDTNVLHESRARLRRDMLIDAPFTELILVRHAQQSFTDEDLASGGPAGPRLSATGELQARLTGEHLANEPVAAIYCSHLNRATATADAVAHHVAGTIEPVVLTDLREIEAHGTEREDSAAVRHRLTEALTGIAVDHAGQSVVVVSHGGAISAFLASILSIDPDIFFFAAHASVTRVRFHEGRWAVQTINENGHLRSRGLVSH